MLIKGIWESLTPQIQFRPRYFRLWHLDVCICIFLDSKTTRYYAIQLYNKRSKRTLLHNLRVRKEKSYS